MRNTLLVALTLICLSCNTGDKGKKEEQKPPSINMYGYNASYSSSFEMGDPKNVEKVLMVYKDWDGGDPAAHQEIFADTLQFNSGDGGVYKMAHDSAMKFFSDYRGLYSMMKSNVYSIFSVNSTDKNESWTCVWAQEIHTEKATNKTDSLEIQESWRFNKDGKVDWVIQHMKPGAPANK
ncbi:MAG: hypothetical protein FJY20_06045 [Bacteroidetes bacterium]|nr:hypothetical protein [Bacteroidota bacterium]